MSYRWRWLIGGLIVLAGVGGWWWLSQRSVTVPTIQLADPAKPADLAGLDTPQKLSGGCLVSYTVHGIGMDAGGVQHYACWAPDEKSIVYCQGPGPEGPWQICKVSLESDDDPVTLTKEGSNIYPEWGRIIPLK